MTKNTETKPTKQYAIWEVVGDAGYFCLFDSIEDAVSSGGDGCEVYVAEYKRIGKFKRKAEIVKIKPRKKRKK